MNIGILGLGTVGGGVVNLLKNNADTIKKRTLSAIDIQQVAVSDMAKKRICSTDGLQLTEQAFDVVNNENIAVIVELIGGTTLAKELVVKALEQGKHVVTANKALLADCGNELVDLAKKNNVQLLFEAAVGGGIPIIETLKSSLISNQIQWLVAIINGTSNFILTEMTEKNSPFDDALAQAQHLGYAEADPSFDINGIDAAHKLLLLSALSFGTPICQSAIFTQGISQIQSLDIQLADELGYVIKHLAIAKKSKDGVELRVHPALIAKNKLLASVNGVMNAVMVKGNFVGPTLYYGAGAGDKPTASAIVSDLMALSAPSTVNEPLGWQQLETADYQSIDTVMSAHYLRLKVSDKTGVLAEISQILANHQISIEVVNQKQFGDEKNNALIALVTNQCLYHQVLAAISEISQCHFIQDEVMHIWLEKLD